MHIFSKYLYMSLGKEKYNIQCFNFMKYRKPSESMNGFIPDKAFLSTFL